MQVTLILSRKSRGATNMSTAEYLISSYDGSSAAHHFSFSRKKKERNITIHCSDQSEQTHETYAKRTRDTPWSLNHAGRDSEVLKFKRSQDI